MTHIINNDDFTTPVAVQQEIRNKFAFTKDAEVEVKKNGDEFEIYKNYKYLFSLNELGEQY